MNRPSTVRLLADSTDLTAAHAASLVRTRRAGAVEIVERSLARIDECESTVHAWAHVAHDGARAQASAIESAIESVIESGGDADRREWIDRPLLGVPVGVKDMIDTADLPTQYNSPLYAGHQPARDAACVSLLRAAGAVVVGKADTVEFASLGRVAATVNPHDPRRTPGGSSSGSAAAVAAGMVPIALGTQTGGSVIRPASFCGVFGMKPTYGLISIEGIKVYAPSLDTIGWMARSVDDLALAARALGVIERSPEPADVGGLRVAVYRTPHWADADAASQEAVADAARMLADAGTEVIDVEGPGEFAHLTENQDIIMHWEGRAAYRAEYELFGDRLHPEFRKEVENAKGRTIQQVAAAYDALGEARRLFDQAFHGFDAVLTPAVPGEAPVGLARTGLATFNRMFTALHGPNITVPGWRSTAGMPIGVQLVGRRFTDRRLLAVAAGLAELVG